MPTHSHSAGTLATTFYSGVSVRLISHTIKDFDAEEGKVSQHMLLNDGTWKTIADHSHSINGYTDSVGGGESFSIMPPYQTIAYIIFTGTNCNKNALGEGSLNTGVKDVLTKSAFK
jgi:hypothetical protein